MVLDLALENRAPHLVHGEPAQATVQAMAPVVDRFATAVHDSGGHFMGFSDLCLQACWPGMGQGSGPAAARAFALSRNLVGWLETAGLDSQIRAALVVGSGLLGSFGGVAGRWRELGSGPVARLLAPGIHCCPSGALVFPRGLGLGDLLGVEPTMLLDAYASVPLTATMDVVGEALEEPEVPLPAAMPCSVVAVEVCGADCQRGDYATRLHGAVRALQRVARVQGGTIADLRHDHRGVIGLVLFNASQGHARRAAVRALRFAQDAGHALADQGLDLPAGVATGELWTWPVGSHWAVVGPAVARANSLVRSTASELLCDAASAELAGSRARLETVPRGGPSPSVQGFIVEHVEPSRALHRGGASGAVGRCAELGRLHQLVGELLAGTTGVLLIEGEIGMGKSRMVDELVARVRGESCRVVVAYAVPGDSAAPLAPWRSVLLQLLELEEPVEPAICRERLEGRLGELGEPADIDALTAILPLDQAAEAPVGPARLLEVVADTTCRLQGAEPLLVVLEDGQWLDSASWSLARLLAVQADQLLVAVALRTDDPELALEAQRLAALPETTIMVLRGLDTHELASLVQRELGIEGLPDELLQWLRASTHGNPRLCLEWVRLMQDEGDLRTEKGRVVSAPAPLELASRKLTGLPALLDRRVSVLPAGIRRTLAVCASAGGVFETQLVAQVHPDAPGLLRVGADLEHLATVGLVQPAPGRSESAWNLAHTAVAEGVHGVLDQPEVKALHAAVAAWYEQHHDDLTAFYPLLALHWIGAQVSDRALRYLELAGAQAMRSGAMPEAVRHYQQALRLAGSGDPGLSNSLRRAHWERSLGDARYACGELDRCAVHYDRALGLLGEHIPHGRLRLVLYAAWQLTLQALHRLLPPSLFQADPDQHSRLLEASHAAERLAERYYYSADSLSLCSSSVLSANLADRVGALSRNARPYASMSYLIGLVGLQDLSHQVYRRAIQIGEQAPDLVGSSVARYTRATFHAGRGEWEVALELGERAVAEAERAAAWQESGVARTIHAFCHFQVGSFGNAEAAYGELMSLARERYNAQHEAWALYGIGECQLQVGRLNEAARSVQQGLAVLRNLDDYPSRLICHGVLACIHARLGRFERARESAELGWTLIRQVRLPFVLPTLEGFAGVAEAYLTLLAHQSDAGVERRELASRAKAVVRRLGLFARIFPVARPRHLLCAGWLAELQGHHVRATRARRAALEDASALGLPFEAAQAKAALAAGRGLSPERASELRADAGEAFEQLGCPWHLQQLRAQQGQSQ